MKNDFDGDSLPSHLAAVKSAVKTAEDTLKMQRIIGNSKTESKDLHECSAVLDVSLVSAAFQYYRYHKDVKNIPLNISSSSSSMWDNSYALIRETDFTQPLDSTNDLEKTLSDLQMDSDLISEWPKFNTDFLNLYNFFDGQIESSDSLGNESTIHESKMNENEVSNPTVVNFEIGDSDSKEYSKTLCNDSSEGALPETDTESFETRSAVSKSSSSSSHHSENTGEERSVLKRFHIEGYFQEELDYEPSEAGETEAKESDNEFCIDDPLKEKESGSFSHYCSHGEVSENSTFQKRIKEIDTPEEHTETCAKQDFISFFENNFQLGPSKSMLQDNYERYFEYEDDDDSESDSEHSFKRNSSRNRQVNDLETLHQPLINSDVSKVSQLNSINEVMLYICEQCKCGNINEAIAVANRYIAISVKAVQLEIFKELFINVINLIKSSVFPVDDVRISKSLGEIMGIFHESKLFNSDLCSLIINECFGCDHAIKTGKELFSFIQKIKVPVNSNALSSYVDIIMPSEIPSLELISFMEYVKYVCNLPCPKTLFCEALGRFSKQEEDSLLVGFSRLCKFLCSVSSKEVDINHLRNFIEFCIKSDNWAQISNFLQAWCNTDGHLISCLTRSFLFRPEDVGLFYEKLAEEIYKHGDVSSYLVGILGQIGVSLMLEVFSRKQYDSAFGILFTLHKFNINYLELQACLYNAPSYLKSIPNFADLFVFPFTVAFAALDICIHLERFRDAYRVFKIFSLNLPADMDEKLKLKVRSRRFGYLLKLAQELFSREPLKQGLQALHDIYSTVEDFSLEELEDFVEEIQVIYNKYLAYVVNGCQLHTALELFECSEGVMKEVFIIHPQVLRGLLVTFSQNDKMDEAYKFFSLGCARKVYNIEQTETEEFVWCLTVMSSWTIFEVEFVIQNFIKNVCLAWDGKHKTEIDMQLSVKIVFKKSEEDSLEIECLKKSHSIDSAKEIVCNVLKSLDSSIKWVENENPVCLELVFETIYNYWMNVS
ncbi:hypothetical protein AVEN_72598-1 [Araneus ventricosus]|uniref:Uncharacterized protein n=1 Tax=Araneus ventricosus TaxID=182803 RepID=A0A4Y2KQS9_ARAVE|nr:hypothetical protein AVEN_72598-1 [Araneus ventricosus]